jgi:outer membrane receptor protein involved in Fe transport
LGGYKTSGVDLELDDRFEASDVGLPDAFGALRTNLMATYVGIYSIQNLPGSPFLNYAGTIGNSTIDPTTQSHPRIKANFGLTYIKSPVDATLRWRFIGAMSNAARLTSATSTAPGTTAINYFDFTANLHLPGKFDLRAGVLNLANKQPPIWTAQGAVDVSTFDVEGRRFFLGASKTFQ